jgi:hypothetical protein
MLHNEELRHLYSSRVIKSRTIKLSQKVAGSIPDEVIGFFNTHNPSSRTMALGSTQYQESSWR